MADWLSPHFERRIAFALVAVCWLLCAGTALTDRIDRDEHMYLAAARLSADHRLYEDFAFLQTPYSVGVYRTVLALSPDPWTLLPARIFKTLVTAAMMGLLFVVLRRLGARPLLAASLISLLYLTDPVRQMAAYARNYDLAQLCILAGIWIAPLQSRDPRGGARLVAVGALAAVAIGFKLTYAPLAALLAIWPVVAIPDRRKAAAGWIALGGLAGLVPAAFTMGGIDLAVLRINLLDYHFMNAELHAALGQEPLATLPDRLSRAIGTLLAREHRPLLSVSVFALALNVAQWSRPRAWVPGPRAWFVLALMAGAIAVAAVPRPIQGAYFGPAFFGMTMFVAVATNRLTSRGKDAMLLLGIATLAVAGSLKVGTGAEVLRRASDPDRWTGVVAHRVGAEIAIAADGRPVVTTHPIYALEAGAAIPAEFATGAFAWRVGSLLGPERRARIRTSSEEALANLLDRERPGAIVTETGLNWDDAMIGWARDEGWTERASVDPRVIIWAP